MPPAGGGTTSSRRCVHDRRAQLRQATNPPRLRDVVWERSRCVRLGDRLLPGRARRALAVVRCSRIAVTTCPRARRHRGLATVGTISRPGLPAIGLPGVRPRCTVDGVRVPLAARRACSSRRRGACRPRARPLGANTGYEVDVPPPSCSPSEAPISSAGLGPRIPGPPAGLSQSAVNEKGEQYRSPCGGIRGAGMVRLPHGLSRTCEGVLRDVRSRERAHRPARDRESLKLESARVQAAMTALVGRPTPSASCRGCCSAVIGSIHPPAKGWPSPWPSWGRIPAAPVLRSRVIRQRADAGSRFFGSRHALVLIQRGDVLHEVSADVDGGGVGDWSSSDCPRRPTWTSRAPALRTRKAPTCSPAAASSIQARRRPTRRARHPARRGHRGEGRSHYRPGVVARKSDVFQT
jgi:hypothetical protein